MKTSFAPRRIVLDNGLTVIHQHNPASPAVVASLSIVAGAVLEPVERSGLATLTAAALRRGTTSRSKSDIGEILDYRGAHLGCSASRHGASLGPSNCQPRAPWTPKRPGKRPRRTCITSWGSR